MAQLMWKISASPNYIKYLSIVGFTNTLPTFEHKYLGHQLTTKNNSLATKVSVDENKCRLLFNIVVESRVFYFDSSDNSWLVLVDNK